jgi:hypothetical protein
MIAKALIEYVVMLDERIGLKSEIENSGTHTRCRLTIQVTGRAFS